MRNPQTRGHRERGSRIRVKEEEGAQALGEKGFFYPLIKPWLKGRFLEKAAGSVTLNSRLQFLWASGRGSNDKLINNFPFPSWIWASPVLLKSSAVSLVSALPVSSSTGTAA